MASAPDLGELLTCPICQDIFTEPMVLKCHHSLCRSCLAALQRSSAVRWKVDCPVCRQSCRKEEIQKDFRTITLLETREKIAKSQKSPKSRVTTTRTREPGPLDNSISVKMCEQCAKLPVRNRCKQCNHMICSDCTATHKTIPAIKNHTITSLDSLIGQHKKKLSRVEGSLRQLEGQVSTKSQQLQLYQHSMDEVQTQTLGVIDSWYQEIHRAIKQHQDMLNSRVSQAISYDKTDMAKVQAHLGGIEDNIRASIEKINGVLEENDPAKVLASTDALVKCVEQGLLRTDLSKYTTPKVLDMAITPGKQWQPSTGIDVQVKRSSKSMKTNTWTTFPADAHTRCFDNTMEITTDTGSKQLLFHAGYIWCLYHNRIDIHNKQGTWIDSFKEHLDNPNGMATMPSGQVIVACLVSGLVLLNSGGGFHSVVAEGSFCDVSADTQFVYGLDYTHNTPCVRLLQKGIFKWTVLRNIELPYDNCNPCNTLQTNGMNIFISAASHSCVFRYHSSGTLLERYEWPGTAGREEHQPPRLCCADTGGQVLVAHFLQDSLWLLHSHTNDWKQINCPGLKNPYGAAFDDEGNLWVVNLTNKLTKYS